MLNVEYHIKDSLFLLVCATGAEPQVVPAIDCIDLPSELPAPPAGTVWLPCDQHTPSRAGLPPLLAVSNSNKEIMSPPSHHNKSGWKCNNSTV